MSDNYPLIVNIGSGQIQELPLGDNLDLTGSNISNVGNIAVADVAVINTIRSDNYQYANGSPFSSGGGTPGGSNTQIQYNDNNTFNGIANLTYDNISGNIAISNVNATNANVAFSNFNEYVDPNIYNITGANPNFDAVNGTIQHYRVYSNFDFHSINISNVAIGGSIVMIMDIQGAGLSMGTTINIKWANGDKTFSPTPGTYDLICLLRIDNINYYGTLTKGYV